MSFQVHIEQLIFDGLPLDRRQAARIQATLEAELIRLLKIPDAWSSVSGGAVPRVHGETVTWQPNEKPESLGERLGQAVYGSVQS